MDEHKSYLSEQFSELNSDPNKRDLRLECYIGKLAQIDPEIARLFTEHAMLKKLVNDLISHEPYQEPWVITSRLYQGKLTQNRRGLEESIEEMADGIKPIFPWREALALHPKVASGRDSSLPDKNSLIKLSGDDPKDINITEIIMGAKAETIIAERALDEALTNAEQVLIASEVGEDFEAARNELFNTPGDHAAFQFNALKVPESLQARNSKPDLKVSDVDCVELQSSQSASQGITL